MGLEGALAGEREAKVSGMVVTEGTLGRSMVGEVLVMVGMVEGADGIQEGGGVSKGRGSSKCP